MVALEQGRGEWRGVLVLYLEYMGCVFAARSDTSSIIFFPSLSCLELGVILPNWKCDG